MTEEPETIVTWTRDFCTAIEAGGRSLVGCLEYAAERQDDARLVAALRGVIAVVAAGYPLSKATALQDGAFSSDYRTVVRYGEMYGEPDAVLRRYVDRPEELAPR